LAGLGHHTGLGDEGVFAPEITEPEEVLGLLTELAPIRRDLR
jgi:enolase